MAKNVTGNSKLRPAKAAPSAAESKSHTDRVMIDGKEVEFRREDVPVDKLRLDPENPRLHYIVKSLLAGERNDEKLHEILWSRDSIKSLAKSIHQNGGVMEPIVVLGDYRVVEGNCRTVCSRELVKMYPHDARFRRIPANVLLEATQGQVDVMLVELHAAGKIQWDAYEQARMIAHLNKHHGKTWDWLAAHVRMARNKLAQLIFAYNLTDEYLQANPDPVNVKKYSLFAEAAKKKEIKERIQEDNRFKASFFAWIRDGKLTDNKQVRRLPAILGNEAAREALERQGFAEAYKVLVKDKPSMTSDLFAAIEDTTARLRSAPFDEIQDLKAGNVQKIVMLRDLHRAIQDIGTATNIQL